MRGTGRALAAHTGMGAMKEAFHVTVLVMIRAINRAHGGTGVESRFIPPRIEQSFILFASRIHEHVSI